MFFLPDPGFDENVKGVEDSSGKNDGLVCLPNNTSSVLVQIVVDTDAPNTNCPARVVTFANTNYAGGTAMDVFNLPVYGVIP